MSEKPHIDNDLYEQIAKSRYEYDYTSPWGHLAPALQKLLTQAARDTMEPIIDRVRQAAKAEAWDRAYGQGAQDEIDSQGFDGGMTGPNRINPYIETGDSDEQH